MRGPCDIIAGTAVVLQAHPAIAARYVGAVRLLGKTEAVRVCQVLGAAQLTAQERRAVADRAERTAARRAASAAVAPFSGTASSLSPSYQPDAARRDDARRRRGGGRDDSSGPESSFSASSQYALHHLSQSPSSSRSRSRSSASHVSVHYSELPQELGGDADDAVALFAARARGVCDGIDYPALVTLGRLDKAVRRVHHAAHLLLAAARAAEAAGRRLPVGSDAAARSSTGDDLNAAARFTPGDNPLRPRASAGDANHRRQDAQHRRHRHNRDDTGGGSDDPDESLMDVRRHRRRHHHHRREDEDAHAGTSSSSTVGAAAPAMAASSSSIAQLEAAARAIYQTLPLQLTRRFDLEASFVASRSATGVYE
jgi:hypothetical protein